MVKIDKRKKYMLVLDTETTNDIDQPLVYDFGFSVVDKKGNIYESYRVLIKEIFLDELEMMKTAYYADKLPQYWAEVYSGKLEIVSLYKAREQMLKTMKKYGIDTVCAYNCRFDVLALNTTQRWLTKSKYRYFFPYNTTFYCIHQMAKDTLCKQKMYDVFCDTYEFKTAHKTPRNKTSAEVVYRYLINDPLYVESHTALDDVLIEAEIMALCFRQHKKMRKEIFSRK